MEFVDFLNKAKPNPTLFGGKGSNLIKLINFGANVPTGFIVNTKSYRNFVKSSQLDDSISQILSANYSPKEIIGISDKIKNLSQKTQIPLDIIEEIIYAYNKIIDEKGEEISFSVRSSANLEDSTTFSFAGQAASFLNNITIEDILISLKNCWMSLFSPQALLYILQIKTKNKNVSLKSLEMAVIIQIMVKSQISGVLFSVNVLNNNNRNQMMINSTWGLGETITSSLVVPDLIILDKKKFKILKSVIGKKERMSVFNPEGSSTILVETKAELKERCSLNDNQLFQLYKLGLTLEANFDYPQDIEWAIENDVLYTLQSRPITTL